MQKLIAIANVVAWGGFWAFGYLALSTAPENSGQMVTAAIMAAIGGGTGMLAFLWLVRHAEAKGYARRPNRARVRGDTRTDDSEIEGETI